MTAGETALYSALAVSAPWRAPDRSVFNGQVFGHRQLRVASIKPLVADKREAITRSGRVFVMAIF